MPPPPPGSRPRPGWWPAYAAVVVLAAAAGVLASLGVVSLPGWTGLAWRAPQFGPPAWTVVLWAAGFLALAAAPALPVVGVWVYLFLVHVVPHYDGPSNVMLTAGGHFLITGLALAGWAVWAIRTRRPMGLPRHPIAWLMLGFVAWVALAALVARYRYPGFTPDRNHAPVFFNALILFLVAARWMGGRLHAVVLALLLGAAPALRAHFDPSGAYLDADLAAIAVMALPLVLLGFGATGSALLRVVLVLIGLYLLALVFRVQNRGALVGLGGAALVLWLFSRHKLWTLAAAAPAAAVGLVLLRSSPFWDRIAALWQGGREANSIIERQEIWKVAWRVFADHPWLGVGPGNFSNVIQQYNPGMRLNFVAHNNFLQVLTETGAVGLGLYVALFGAAAFALARLARLAGRDWPGPAGAAVLAALAAYFGAGLFISRSSMVLAYILAGWAVALHCELFGCRGE